MKKVKTFIASLMIILATAVLSACSCSGDKSNTDVTPVACQSISISSDFAGATKNDETGYIKIDDCQLGDEFAITYKLGPDNTTQTRVDWSFSENNIVGCKNRYDYNDGVYSYSRGTEQTIKFVANKSGKTTIKFSPHGTDKFVLVDVSVSTPKATWPTFLAPSGLDYDPTTGEVTWNPVTKYQKPSGEITDAPSQSGQVTGLYGYIVSWTNLVTGEKGGTDQPIAVCCYGLPNDALQRGESYAVSVVAKGDNWSVNDSASSDVLRFHQLATATDLKNENGVISFTSPQYAEHNFVYYEKDNSSRFVDRISNGSEACSFNYKDTFEKGNSELFKYNVYVVSYPKDYDARETGKNYVVKSGIRYYPSIKSSEIEIQRLYAPTISFDHNIATDNNKFTLQASSSVAGVTFDLGVDANQPHLSSILSWRTTNAVYEDKLGVVYKYQVFKGDSKVYPAGQEYETGMSFDTSEIRKYPGEYTLKVFACGDKTITIDSAVSEFTFKVLGSGNSAEASIDNENTLTVSQINNAQSANIQGVDFYFLQKTSGNEYSQSNYKFKFVETNNTEGSFVSRGANINLVSLNLEPGEYDIFARFVGINRGTATSTNSSATGDWFKVTNGLISNSIKVSKPVVGDIELSSTGILSFKNVYANAKYKINIVINGYNTQTEEFTTSLGEGETVSIDISNQLSSITYSNLANATLAVTCCGNDVNYIDSQPSSLIKFTRRQDPENITLSDYNLSFGALSGVNYKITLVDNSNPAEPKTYQTTWQPTSTNASYNLNSATSITYNGKNNVSFAEIIVDMVNMDKTSFEFKVQAIGVSNGSLDSNVVSGEFGCTNQPKTVTIKNVNTGTEETPSYQNMLSWTMGSGNSLNDQKFEITFVTYKNGENGKEIDNSDQKTLSNDDLTIVSSENGDIEYQYDISNILKAQSFKNKIVEINVLQKVSNRFYGKVSSNTYGIALNEVSMSSAIIGNAPVIQFTALNCTENINYIMTVVETDNTVEITDATMGANYGKSLSDLGITESGIYTITLKAVLNNATISNTTPYGIESESTNIGIRVLSSQIAVTADGNNATFVSIHSQAKYTLQYQFSTDTDWISIVSDLSGDEGQAVKYDLTQVFEIAGYTGGDLDIRVVPTLDYANTGCLLTNDEAQVNSLTKLKATTLSSNNGKITYTIADTFLVTTGEEGTSYNYTIALYADGKEMSTDTYIVDYANKEITITSSTYMGDHTYTACVRAKGYLTSNLSNELALTMINTPIDLTKSEDYITWSIDANATSYVLMISKDGESITTQTIEISNAQTDGSGNVIGATVKVEKVIDENKVFAEDENVAKFEDGKLMYKFTNLLLGETATAGDYLVRVKPYTTKNNFLTGIESSPITITKLSNDLQIKVEGAFKLNEYKIAGTQLPQTMQYEIYNNISQTFDKGESDASLTLVKFEANAINFEVAFQSTDGENFATIGTPIQIAYDNATHKALIYNAEGGQFEENVDLTVVNEDDVYYVSISNSLIPTNSEDATQNACRAVVSYSQMIYSNEVAYDSISEDITSQDNSYNIDLNALGIDQDGDYSIKVKFIGNNANIVDSNEITSDTSYSRLLATTVNTQNGVLTWEDVENAGKYVISITGAGMNVGQSVSESEDNSIQADLQVGTLTFEIEGQTQITEDDIREQNSSNSFVVGEEYTIKIMSYSQGYLASVWSEEFKFKKLIAPTNLVIKASTSSVSYDEIDYTDPENPVTTQKNISVGDPILTWEDINTTVTEKLNYIYNMGEKDVVIFNSPLGTLVGQLLEKNRISGTYSIKMKVQGNTTIGTNVDGLLTSDYSDEIQVVYVDETQRVSFENGSFSWDEVNGAYAYKLTFKQGADIKYTTYTKSNTYSFKNSEFEGCGYYTVQVNAITDPTKTIVSSELPEGGNKNTKDIFKSPNVSEIFVQDGKIAWSIETSALDKMLSNVEVSLALNTALENVSGSNIKQKAINYLKQKINIQGQAIDSADEILYPFFMARLSLNNQETIVTATGVDLCNLQLDAYTPAENGNYIVFTYNMATMPTITQPGDTTVETDTKTYKPGKYVIKVAPIGNAINSETISSVDGKYATTFEAYKPQTPGVPSVDGNSNKMYQGNILWQLVQTADSGYHNNYQLIAQYNEKMISRDINILDGTGTVADDDHVYSGKLTTIFADKADATQNVAVNTNYTMNLRVIGTANSKVLGTGEKAYLNSDIFNYGDEYMNILSNISLNVTGNQIRWEPSEYSSSTKLMIYGPFDYAPDQNDNTTWGEKSSYEEALSEWKNSIASLWTSIVDTTNENYAENHDKYYHELDFDAITIEGDEGIPVETTRTTSYTLSNNSKFGAGSYIIRKQEIGNGKGIIDTKLYKDSNGYDLLMVNESSPFEIENMGVIATKLDTTSAIVDNVWVNNGKFVWNSVPRANAYRISLVEYDSKSEIVRDDYYTLVSYSDSLNYQGYHEWDIPSIVSGNDTLYNNNGNKYSVRITATHVDNLNDINCVTSNNYFDGEKVESEQYERTDIPISLTVTTANDVSYLQWNGGSVDATVAKYAIHVIHNDTTTELDETSSRNTSYNISSSAIFAEAGRYIVALRAIGNSDGSKYLNSSLSSEIIIIKLPKPILQVENGIFGWGSELTDLTNSQITDTDFKLEYYSDVWETKVDNGFASDTESLESSVSTYPLFSEIADYNAEYELSNEYPAGKYRFSIRYSPKVSNEDNTFVIASPTDTLVVNKLSVPEPKVSKISIAEGLSTNQVEWAKVDNAQAYKARVLVQALDENNERVEYQFDGISNIDTAYFTEDANKVYLNIDKILNSLGSVSFDSGASLKVYIQAVGTELFEKGTSAETDIYINSSFSDKCEIAIPAKPTSSEFNSNTGVLSWTIDNRAGHNAQITMSYTVSNISKSVFNYWITTANSYGAINYSENIVSSPNRAYEEIANRVFTYSVQGTGDDAIYTLYVTDIVLLEAQGEPKLTPTSYQVTSIGTNYTFKINIMVASTVEGSGELISGTYIHSKAETFTPFEYGDGSENYRYGVNDYTSFNLIRNFTDKNFEIIKDINVTSNWDMIDTEFTGSIVGKQFTSAEGEQVYPTITTITPNIYVVGNTHYISFMKTNSGSISNLNFVVNISYLESGAANVYVAGLSITNSGTIDNVNVESTTGINIRYTSISNSIYVTGLVYENNGGTISSSSVTVGENTSVNNAGIYAMCGGQPVARASGIAGINTGTITDTYFEGDITANYVAGIASNNSGTIYGCYSAGNAYIVDTNMTEGAQGKNSEFGGLVGTLSGNGTASIINSYSIMSVTLEATSGTAVTAYIGGLYATPDNNLGGATIVNCYTAITYVNNAINNVTINAYYFGVATSNISYTNCYYLVIGNSMKDTDTTGVTQCTSLDILRTELGVLVYNGKSVYDVAEEHPYPILKK